jgi:hypothetical protein
LAKIFCRPAGEFRSSKIGEELSAIRSKPPTPSLVGPIRKALTATIKNAAEAISAIVAVLRPTFRPAFRKARRPSTDSPMSGTFLPAARSCRVTTMRRATRIAAPALSSAPACASPPRNAE